ncbi:hypothetical protein RA876_09635 [Rhodoferax antarcticus]|nr:hypothetical protein RA876_09635 [Rhodoferax antarcticus]
MPQAAACLSTGSRRRRLWELPERAHCPVVGVCLPMPILRRVAEKTFQGRNIDTDYGLHSGAVSECRKRTVLADGMQRELEKRYAMQLRQAARLKQVEALSDWWAQCATTDLAGALWATLTHPRCTPKLEAQILAEVHMLQHQVGTTQPTDNQRLHQLAQDKTQLAAALAQAQARTQQVSRDRHERLQAQQRQIAQLKAELTARDSTVKQLRETVQTLSATTNSVCQRNQANEVALQAQRINALERSLQNTEHECQRRGRVIDAQAAALRGHATAENPARQPVASATKEAIRLENRAVLCVGGRTASVPHYRHIVESTGGRFLHHDGGEEESLTKLDSTLVAADLVICQTGCISHNAYWRVKDYCKRTGKQCVYVETSGTTGLKRALTSLSNQ